MTRVEQIGKKMTEWRRGRNIGKNEPLIDLINDALIKLEAKNHTHKLSCRRSGVSTTDRSKILQIDRENWRAGIQMN